MVGGSFGFVIGIEIFMFFGAFCFILFFFWCYRIGRLFRSLVVVGFGLLFCACFALLVGFGRRSRVGGAGRGRGIGLVRRGGRGFGPGRLRGRVGR